MNKYAQTTTNNCVHLCVFVTYDDIYSNGEIVT